MQEMQFASFASPEWKGVVGTLPGIERPRIAIVQLPGIVLQVPFPSTAR